MESQKTTLLAIRHGETQWNVEELFQGHGDSPLTSAGRDQARALARRMKDIHFDSLISSDLGRALETASIIAEETGHTIEKDARLRERNFGDLEGLTYNIIKEQHAPVLAHLDANDPDYVIPNGESLRQHYQRNVAWFEERIERSPGSTVALIVHGGGSRQPVSTHRRSTAECTALFCHDQCQSKPSSLRDVLRDGAVGH